MAGELVSAYIRLIPTVEGIQGATAKALSPAVGQADIVGKRAGARFGGAFGISAKKLLLAGGGLLAGIGIGKFIGSSADAFKELNAEVKDLQRTAGGSVKDVSELRGALQLSGVEVKKAAPALKIFSKNLTKATADSKKSAAMQKLLGTSFQDANGQVLNLNKLLPKVAETFKGMADGPQKTALALQLFGRQGATLLPFLNKGSAGIRDLEAQARKLGITLDETSQKKWIAYREESRRADAAMQGLKVTIGGAVLPIFTRFSEALTNQLIPAFSKVINFIKNNPISKAITNGLMKAIGDAESGVDRLKKKFGGIDFGNLDGKKVGKALADGILFVIKKVGTFGEKIADSLTKAVKSVDWVGLGIKLGPFVLGFIVGLTTGLIQGITDPQFYKPVVEHLPIILFALLTTVLAPAKFLGPIARIAGRIPFVGKFFEGLLRGINGAAVSKFTRGLFRDIGKAFTEGFGRIRLPGAGLITKIIGSMKALPGRIKSFLGTVGTRFGVAAIDWAERMGKGLRALPGKAVGWLKATPARIKALFSKAGTLLTRAGSAIADGLIAGIKKGWHVVTDGIHALIMKIPKVVRDFFGINSPSRMFIGFGENIAAGLALGMDNSHDRVLSSTSALVSNALPAGATASLASGASVTPTSAPKRVAFVITNWLDGTGYFTEIANGQIAANAQFAGVVGRMA